MARRADDGRQGRTFDWPRARDRIAMAQETLAADIAPSPEAIDRILQERAARLATVERTMATTPVDVIVFRLGESRYAIEASQVDAVIAVTGLTSLPGVPACYLGLIGHRGAIYPLADPTFLLGGSRQGGRPSHAILIGGDDAAIAIAVDSLDGLARIDAATIALADRESVGHASIQGIAPDSTIVIDGRQLIQDARFVVNDQPVAPRPVNGGKTG